MGQACATADGHCWSTRSRSINPNKQIAHGSPTDAVDDNGFKFNVLVDDFVESNEIKIRISGIYFWSIVRNGDSDNVCKCLANLQHDRQSNDHLYDQLSIVNQWCLHLKLPFDPLAAVLVNICQVPASVWKWLWKWPVKCSYFAKKKKITAGQHLSMTSIKNGSLSGSPKAR